jgi:predicted dehydrogenase
MLISRPVKVLLVGFGRIGQQHARLLGRLNGSVRLAGIVDPYADLALLGQEFSGIPFYLSCKDWRESGKSADLMLIASPNAWHPTHLGYAMDMRMPALVEKPLCNCTEHADALIARSEAEGIPCWVMMQARWNPILRHLKELVDGGELGELLHIDIQCYWNRDHGYYRPGGWQGHAELDGGTLYTQFSHVVDVMQWIFGPWAEVQARLHNRTHASVHQLDDGGRITYTTSGRLRTDGSPAEPALGTMVYSTSAYGGNLDQSITVLGSKGSVRISGQYMNQFYRYKVQGRDKPPILPTAGPDEHRLALWRQVIGALQSNSGSQGLSGMGQSTGSQTLVGLREARSVIALIENLYANAERGAHTMSHLESKMQYEPPRHDKLLH